MIEKYKSNNKKHNYPVKLKKLTHTKKMKVIKKTIINKIFKVKQLKLIKL